MPPLTQLAQPYKKEDFLLGRGLLDTSHLLKTQNKAEKTVRAREMAQQLRELDAFTEGPGSVPYTHTEVFNNSLYIQVLEGLMPPSGLYRHCKREAKYTNKLHTNK